MSGQFHSYKPWELVDSVLHLTDTLSGKISEDLNGFSESYVKEPVSSFFSTRHADKNFISYENERYDTDWITIHLLITLGLIAWIRIYFGKRLKQVFKSFFGISSINSLQREGNVFTERISIALLLIYLITMSLMIYLAILHTRIAELIMFSGFRLFALSILGVLLLWIIKTTLITLTGIIFRNQVLLADIILLNFIYNAALGMLFIPIIILSVYIPSGEVLYAGVALWFIVFIYRILRQLFTSPGYTNFSYVNRILYLCTFEIIPFLVVIKLVMSRLG